MTIEGVKTPAAVEVKAAATTAQQQQKHTALVSDHKNGILQTLPPSHVLEDGRFIYLPPPNAAERSRFFERSIARHGLLERDMQPSDRKALAEDKKEEEEEEKETAAAAAAASVASKNKSMKDKTAPKIHPLWIASARLDSGMNELNRAINLATLVNMNEFFTYTNVVDPRQMDDTATAAAASSVAAKTSTGTVTSSAGGGIGGGGVVTTDSGGGGTSAPVSGPKNAASAASLAEAQEHEQSRQIESLFCLKRKRRQFEQASKQLKRHQKRLRAGVYAQRVIDQRLFQLRQRWKLMLPEHGTRARLHAPRTDEVVAIDVDLYNNHDIITNRDRDNRSYRRKISLAGRLASRVPRFATIELKDDFNVLSYLDTLKKKGKDKSVDERGSKESKDDDGDGDGDDDVDMKHENDTSSKEYQVGVHENDDKRSGEQLNEAFAEYTRAEPFAVADPNLGRVQENFDPTKIPMLNLQIEIHKSSTGFVQSAQLEPPRRKDSYSCNGNDHKSKLSALLSSSSSSSSTSSSGEVDEELLSSLQHSLFCANLFESMRSELDTEADADESQTFVIGRGRTNKGLQNMAWLASESDENYVAPPSFLVGDYDQGMGRSAMSVIHCHDGEVKVQLDYEYTLCIKLVEANADDASTPKEYLESDIRESGTLSPEQLHVLCRALLLHAQEVQHQHSLEMHKVESKNDRNESDNKSAFTVESAGIKSRSSIPPKPFILQSCANLGCKILFEKRIRSTLLAVNKWIQSICGEKMYVQWLPLPMFNLRSEFSIGFRNVALDVAISCASLVVTKVANNATYRKVHFRSEQEFQFYLKLELKRALSI